MIYCMKYIRHPPKTCASKREDANNYIQHPSSINFLNLNYSAREGLTPPLPLRGNPPSDSALMVGGSWGFVWALGYMLGPLGALWELFGLFVGSLGLLGGTLAGLAGTSETLRGILGTLCGLVGALRGIFGEPWAAALVGGPL